VNRCKRGERFKTLILKSKRQFPEQIPAKESQPGNPGCSAVPGPLEMGPIPPRQRVLAKQVPQRTAVLSTAAAGRRHGRTSLPPAARNDRGTISLGAQAHVQWPSTRSCLAWRSFGSSTRKFPDVAGSDLPHTAGSDCRPSAFPGCPKRSDR
jgi:hypothetical protein